MAEVSLILDNADGSLPIEFAEVRVTRRLYRSGDSEYLLNGARVRLRDITQLLLHAGLSPDSYTVIGQGSIDELILQRPGGTSRRIRERGRHPPPPAQAERHALEAGRHRGQPRPRPGRPGRARAARAPAQGPGRPRRARRDLAVRAARPARALVPCSPARAPTPSARAAERDLTASTQVAACRRGRQPRTRRTRSNRVDHALVELEDALAVLRPRAEGFREQARAAERALAITRERTAGPGRAAGTAPAQKSNDSSGTSSSSRRSSARTRSRRRCPMTRPSWRTCSVGRAGRAAAGSARVGSG